MKNQIQIVPFPSQDVESHPGHVTVAELTANRLLNQVPAFVLMEIARAIPRITFTEESIIFEENELGDSAYLILSGTVRISKCGRGGQQETLTFLHGGDYFGEMALLDATSRSAQASSADGTTLGRVDRETWNLILQLAPQQLMRNFAWSQNERLRNNNQKYIEEMVRSQRLTMLGQTLGSVVHDLRSPLTCIFGALQMLQDRIKDPDAICFFKMIRQSVETMHSMTEEILDYSKGITRLNVSRFLLSELINDISNEEAHAFSSGTVILQTEIEQDTLVEIDRTRIYRVIVNLLKNAREAQPRGGIVNLSVLQKGNYAVIRVQDQGCGIEPNRLASIFEPFVTHGKIGGTGLGLAIAKSVVEAHSGRLTVSSEFGIGSLFEVHLPVCLAGLLR